MRRSFVFYCMAFFKDADHGRLELLTFWSSSLHSKATSVTFSLTFSLFFHYTHYAITPLHRKFILVLTHEAMGSVQTKTVRNSSHGGLEKKMENEYIGKSGFNGHRRSTGQKYSQKESDTRVYNNELGNTNGSEQEGGKVIGGSNKGERNGGNVSNRLTFGEEQLVDGWPKWLIDNVPTEVLAGLVPKSAESYVKLDKVGEGTYSNVYKARDRKTGKIVALKKVRFNTTQPESVKFMAREIMLLQKLDHPNIVKLEGLATSRMQYSIYLVFDFMWSDLTKLIASSERLTEPQIKCFMHQLLSGLQHCHERGILHRDIKGSNLLIDKNGILKIADFGLANYYAPKNKHPLTNRVVTLWYRAPELLLGARDYGVGIDLWSAGCLLAEMFAGKPIMPGRTEVEQLHRIFELCGTPSEEYWKKLKLSTTFRPPQFTPSFLEDFRGFPTSTLNLLSTLLALYPAYRGSAASALQSAFFSTSPLACSLSDLPVIYNEDDELDQINDQKKYSNSKMRRSRTHREHRKKYLSAEKSEEDSIAPKENPQSEESGSTTTSSTSSGSNLTGKRESPLFSISSTSSSNEKISPRAQSYFSNTNSKLPPLPKSKTRPMGYNGDNNMYRTNQVQRSVSSIEMRNSFERDR